jgi:GAF domain-containing protein
MIVCRQCRNVIRQIGSGLNGQVETDVLLESAARSIVEEFDLKGCHFRLISRDRMTLDSAASFGLSDAFLNKGPVDAERSVSEALDGKVVEVFDCANDGRIQYPTEFVNEGISSMLTIPLETRGQVVGVMRLYSGTPREFSSDEVEFFKVAALFCTSAIVHSMFHGILGHVTDSIRSSLELTEVLDTIAQVVCEDLRAKGCMIQLLDRRSKKLEPRAWFGLGRNFVSQSADLFDHEVCDQLLAGDCVQIHEGRSDPCVKKPELIAGEGASSILLIPLMSRGQGVGMISIYTHHPYRFSDDELQLMLAIGEQCSLAIDNAKLFSALKKRYENLVDDFQLWFEHTQSYPSKTSSGRPPTGEGHHGSAT